MAKRKVLYVCHNHPTLYPGGAEAYALELYEGLRRRAGAFEPLLLARTGPMPGTERKAHEGTPFSAVGDDPNQTLFHAELADFDFFFLTTRNKDSVSTHYVEYLRAHRPDVVHFQHTLFLGYDFLLATRRELPDVPIVYTLHEYLPICHHNGQMVRKATMKPCTDASPRRCSECFPDISPQQFFLRRRYIESMLSVVDQFVAPSRFLMERYVDWGIPAEKIRVEEYGRQMNGKASTEDESVADARPRNRLGFFGQLNPYKGADVLLTAMKRLAADAADERAAHLWVHGANLEIQPNDFRKAFAALVEETRDNVTIAGRYDPTDLPRLMRNVDWVIVPSIWWENSPLVIQEAFMHGRPVICSDIGGMAEKVRDGVNGLHFRAGDATSLAETIRRAVTSPGLWETLARGIEPVYAMDQHVGVVESMYESLLARRAGVGVG